MAAVVNCKLMKRAAILLAIVLLSVSAADKKKKPPDVTVAECAARRGNGKITFDGKVRATGEKPIKGLVLLIDFLSTDNVLLTTFNAEVEEDLMAVGSESSFHFDSDEPPRAIRYRFNATDRGGRDLRVANAGPFAIE